ncbi:MAG: hypothetical protein NTY29_08735, partial [Proteobacteria bacterium]|nr:hypothetical protein [Pseudomonadota bacterium]
AHLFDFNKNLYGKKISLQFIERLRGEKKFRDAKTLAAQIEKDIWILEFDIISSFPSSTPSYPLSAP